MTEQNGDGVHGPVDPIRFPQIRARIPLAIYIGETRRVIGDALIEGDTITPYFDPKRSPLHLGTDIQELSALIEMGIITDVSITFNAPPAIPVLDPETRHVKWKKAYE